MQKSGEQNAGQVLLFAPHFLLSEAGCVPFVYELT
jgi:hypothetical protein